MLKKIGQQFRKPDGRLGRFIAYIMRKSNGGIYSEVIQRLEIKDGDYIFEIGYGPGEGIATLMAKNKTIQVQGLDFSELMYEEATKRNKKSIDANRVKLEFGDIKDYPITQNYDKIFAINVVYFWENPREIFEKLYKMLSPKGIFVCFVKSPEQLGKYGFTRNENFNKHSIVVLKGWLEEVGFKEVEVTPFNNNVGGGVSIKAIKA